MSNSFSVVYNRDGVSIYPPQELHVLFQGQWSISLQFQHFFEFGKYCIPWNNIKHWKQEFLNPWQAVLQLINLLYLSFALSATFREFRTTVEICNAMQCYQWKTFECLFECIDLNCISMFRDIQTIFPILKHIFAYNFVAKWQLKLTWLVILVKLLLEKENCNQI